MSYDPNMHVHSLHNVISDLQIELSTLLAFHASNPETFESLSTKMNAILIQEYYSIYATKSHVEAFNLLIKAQIKKGDI